MNNRILSSFGFTRMPFVKNLPVKDIFRSGMIQGLLGMFEIGIETEDIMLVFGEIGCGKSVALRLFVDSIDENNYYPLYLKSSKMNGAHLYKAVLAAMKIESPFRFHASRMLYEKVIPDFRKKPIIILDDAQDLGDDALLEIKNLVNFEADSKNRVCVILAGQLEIMEKLRFSLYTPLLQRIRLQYQAGGMSLEETCKYIRHHLTICGKEASVFTDDALSEIFKRTNGIARLIDKECYRAILAACVKEKTIIEPSILPPSDVKK